MEKHRKEIEQRIRSDATIIALVEEEDCLVAHFVIDIERKASDLTHSEFETNVNDLAVQRVEIVSACLPGYPKYGAVRLWASNESSLNRWETIPLRECRWKT